jgi:hypothetical protein
MNEVQAAIYGGAHRIDGLFAGLRARNSTEVWVDLEPTATMTGAISTILTAGYAGARRMHLKSKSGWVDAVVGLPLPPVAESSVVIHDRLVASLGPTGVRMIWQSDRACDAVPPDATVAGAELDGYLTKSCGDRARCVDRIQLGVDRRVSVQGLVDTLGVLRRRGGDSLSFVLALDDGAAPRSRRRCGAPLPTGGGGLKSEQVRSVVASHAGALRACYEIEAQKNPDLRGGVTVAWEIDEGGVVTNASVSSRLGANERLEACILRQVRSWQFPKSDAPTTIAAYPFRFGVADPPSARGQ